MSKLFVGQQVVLIKSDNRRNIGTVGRVVGLAPWDDGNVWDGKNVPPGRDCIVKFNGISAPKAVFRNQISILPPEGHRASGISMEELMEWIRTR